MRVDIRLLGDFGVVVDGEPVPGGSWRRRSAAALVKLLALARGHRLRREQVIDALWPDLLLDEAAPRLHKAAYYARSALGVPDSVVLSGESVALLPDAETAVDVDLFDAAAGEARAEGGPHAAAAALDHYRGDLLPDDLYEPWTEPAREHLRLLHTELLRQAGRWEELIAADPTDEEAHLRLIQESVLRGDRSTALRQFERLEQTLRRELDVGPGEAALALRDEALGMSIDIDQGARPASRVTPVPPPATSTVGRDRDVALVLDLLDRSRIVTLVGPGGVGKTRLAVEVALRRSRSTSVEACFVDLTKVDDPGLVPELIGREIGVHVGSGADANPMLEEAFRGRSLILVLDNFEHVVDAAGVVARIVQWSPGVNVLSTSRARLHVAGEQIFDVPPLSVVRDRPLDPEDLGPASAVALFEQAATAVDPGFELAPNLAEVVAICRTVDGLPLAIELAASHVRTLPPALLRSRLGVRLGSPGGAARDAPPRQQTIPATIDWSLQLLGEAEQRLFTRLGVFAGAVPLEAVEQVCADKGADVLEPLGRLVDQSLVRRVTNARGEARFVLLELLRERARDLLSAAGEERVVVAQRHALYVADVLDDLEERRWTDAAVGWIDTITDMLAEIRSARAWARQRGDATLAARITADLGTYWHREGHHAEGVRWTQDALADADTLDPALAARLILAAGFATWPRDPLEARGHFEESAARFRRLGYDRYLAYSLALVSATYIGDDAGFRFAMEMCEEGIALGRRVGERPLVAQALNIQGELARARGDDQLARTAYDEGRELAAAAGDEAHLSMFLANLSYLADHRGDYEEARRLGVQALQLCWSLGRRMMAAWTLSELAGPELGLGRAERGALLVGAANEALRVLGATRQAGDTFEHQRVVRDLCAKLGSETFDRLATEGARLSLDDAVALALSDNGT